MTRLLSLGLVVSSLSGPALAQVEVVTTPGTPPHPVYDILRRGDDLAVGPDRSVCVVGSSNFGYQAAFNAVSFDGSGALLWEAAYEWIQDPGEPYLGLFPESVQAAVGGEGWIFAASGSSQDALEPDCFPKNDALLRVKQSGEVLWGVRFPGDRREDYVGYKYPPQIQVRELPDGSFFAVATRTPRDERTCLPTSCSAASTGVAVRVGRDGSTLFAREYGYRDQKAKSELLFADLTVIGEYVYVLGTVETNGGCDATGFQINTLLIRMNWNGDVLNTWEFDRPAAENAQDFASSICSIDKQAYFSFVDHMPYYSAGDSTVVSFDTSSGVVSWAQVYSDYHIDYGSLEVGLPGSIVSGGHQGQGEARGCGISTFTGLPLWFQSYDNPLAPPGLDFDRIHAVGTGGPAGGYWLIAPSSVEGIHLIGSTPIGKSVCSSRDQRVETFRAELRIRPSSVSPFRDLETKEWKPEAVFLPTETIDPCRR
jgi:hypothetical protein